MILLRPRRREQIAGSYATQAFPGHGTFARIFFISEAVKAHSVCVRMLPKRSAASKTLAAVSSSGASNTHT